MSRGFIVVVTAFLSVIFLKKIKDCSHWIAIAIVFIGITFVGLSGYFETQDKNPDDVFTLLLGLSLILIA